MMMISNLTIIGLGNPGSSHKNNLHNAGFLLVDFINGSEQKGILPSCSGGSPIKVSVFKTASFMNDSGSDVLKILQKTHKKGTLPEKGESLFDLTGDSRVSQVSPEFMWLLAHDDIDIPLGKFKITFGNTSGGHKGVQSVIDTLGTKDFWRIRIGVRLLSYDPKVDKAEDWVLQDFSKEQMEALHQVFPAILDKLSSFNLSKIPNIPNTPN